MSSNDNILKSPLPLVNDSNISSFINQFVITHGKVQNINNNTLTIIVNTQTNKEILVNNCHKNFEQGIYVKIIGKVAGDQSIEFLDDTILENDFDLDLINQIVPIWNHKVVAPFCYTN